MIPLGGVQPIGLVIAALLLTVPTRPALAQQQDAAPAPRTIIREEAQTTDDYRRALAARMVAVKFKGVEASLRETVEADLEGLAELSNIEAAWLRKTMGDKVIALAKTLLDEIGGIYAETLTVAELEAATAFMESPEGRSIAFKEGAMMEEVLTILETRQVEFVTEIFKSYCAQFTCSTSEGKTPATSGRAKPR